MKYIHSMWSTPSIKNNYNNNNDVEYLNKNFYSYFLSVLLIKKLGHTIELFCDERTFEIYSLIPYDKIHIIDFDSDGINSKFWIWGKIKAQMLMTEPYIHIDGDVFLFRDIIGDRIETGEYSAVVQQVENKQVIGDNFATIYLHSRNPFIDLKSRKIDWDKYGLVAYNCGVVGFHDMKLKNEYVNCVKDILVEKSNDENFVEVTHKYTGMFLIAEQSLLYYILSENNIKPFEIFPYDEIVKRNFNWNSMAAKMGYCHMWSYTKYKESAIKKMKYKIINYFPEYNHIIEKFENEIK